MKNFKFLKSIIFMVLALISLTFNSCEPEDNRPACEKNNTGTFKIINNSVYTMIVDIDAGRGWLGERTIGAWGSVTYSNVDAGGVTVYEYDAATGEGYWDSYVDACEITEFMITISKKSTEDKEVTSNKDFTVNLNPLERKLLQ